MQAGDKFFPEIFVYTKFSIDFDFLIIFNSFIFPVLV
jgi:hypothetical protein